MTTGFQKNPLSAIGLQDRPMSNDEFFWSTHIEVLDTQNGVWGIPDTTDIYYDHETATVLSFDAATSLFSARTHLAVETWFNYQHAFSRLDSFFVEARPRFTPQLNDALTLAILSTLKYNDAEADGWFAEPLLGNIDSPLFPPIVARYKLAREKAQGRSFRSEPQRVKIVVDLSFEHSGMDKKEALQFELVVEKFLKENVELFLRARFSRIPGLFTFVTDDPVPPELVTTITITSSPPRAVSSGFNINTVEKYRNWILLRSEKESFEKIRKELGVEAVLHTHNAKDFLKKINRGLALMKKILMVKRQKQNAQASALEKKFFRLYEGIVSGIDTPSFAQFDANTSGGTTLSSDDLRNPYTGNHVPDEKIFIFISGFMALFPDFRFNKKTYKDDFVPFIAYAANVGAHELCHAFGCDHDVSSRVSVMMEDLHDRSDTHYTVTSALYPLNSYDEMYLTFISSPEK